MATFTNCVRKFCGVNHFTWFYFNLAINNQLCHRNLHEDLGESLGFWTHVHSIHTNRTTLEESLSITILRCDLAIATHARKMHK